MSTWKDFYNQIRDPAWPDCNSESEFANLSAEIQHECITVFGYVPGSFQKTSKLENRVFPINTETACQLKWNWSTLYLATETTSSCHRTNQHQFDVDEFDFHNTPSKLDDRHRMLQGQWPQRGCNYCQRIEQAGGQSDRITNLNFPGMHAPVELDHDPVAVAVTPRILEVYFDNTCNLKCLYCGPHFSSLWDAEIKRYGAYSKNNLTIIKDDFVKSVNTEQNKQKLFAWLKQHSQHLTNFNILGGEPLYQPELEEVLELLQTAPAPELKLQIFTNLNARLPYLKKIVERVKHLVDTDCIREFEVTASLDCWGPEQEYVRFPLNLASWQENFEYLLSQHWINLIVSSTITPLTIKTLPTLLQQINRWRQVRPIYHYQNSVTGPSFMMIDIFGDAFKADFDLALQLKSASTQEEVSSKDYLAGIAKQANSTLPRIQEIEKLYYFLNEIDRRRHTNWKETFPWLVDEFNKYNLGD